MTFFRLFQGRPTRFAMFRHVQRRRPDRKSPENTFLGTLDVSPFIVKTNRFERLGKFWKKKHDLVHNFLEFHFKVLSLATLKAFVVVDFLEYG